MNVASFFACAGIMVALGGSFGCGGSVAGEPSPSGSSGSSGSSGNPASGEPGSAQNGPLPSDLTLVTGEFGYQPPTASQNPAMLTGTASDASYNFDCMSGSSGPIEVDPTGAFSTQGTLTSQGGPIETIDNVTFSGYAAGDTITLSVSWPTTANGGQPYTETFGPMTLVKGTSPTGWPGCI